jgi:hypothetical protein
LEAIFHTIFKPAEEEAIRKKSEDRVKKIVKKRVSKKATKIVKQDDGHIVDKDQVALGRARLRPWTNLKLVKFVYDGVVLCSSQLLLLPSSLKR